MNVKTYIYVKQPSLYYSKRFLETGIKKYEERKAAIFKDVDLSQEVEVNGGDLMGKFKTSNYVMYEGMFWTAYHLDTPFCIIVPSSKLKRVWDELKRLEDIYDYAEENDNTIITSAPCLSMSYANIGNKHFIIGSIRKAFYDYLTSKQNNPLTFDPEIQAVAKRDVIPYEESELNKIDKQCKPSETTGGGTRGRN